LGEGSLSSKGDRRDRGSVQCCGVALLLEPGRWGGDGFRMTLFPDGWRVTGFLPPLASGGSGVSVDFCGVVLVEFVLSGVLKKRKI